MIPTFFTFLSFASDPMTMSLDEHKRLSSSPFSKVNQQRCIEPRFSLTILLQILFYRNFGVLGFSSLFFLVFQTENILLLLFLSNQLHSNQKQTNILIIHENVGKFLPKMTWSSLMHMTPYMFSVRVSYTLPIYHRNFWSVEF